MQSSTKVVCLSFPWSHKLLVRDRHTELLPVLYTARDAQNLKEGWKTSHKANNSHYECIFLNDWMLMNGRLSFEQQFELWCTYGGFTEQVSHSPLSPSSTYCFHKTVFILFMYETSIIWSLVHNLLLVYISTPQSNIIRHNLDFGWAQ